MKKIFFSILFFFLLPAFIFAQRVNIEGIIFDQSKNIPLEFVSVMLLKPDSTIYNGANTDQNGNFVILDVESGSYTVRATYLGYQSLSKKITIKGGNQLVKLGTLYMKEDNNVLDELVVVAQGPQVKFEIDKKVFSVDQNIAAAGGSTLDVLQNIPSVDVDTDGNVSLRNNSNVEIWINGKPAGLSDDNRGQILEQMPAGTVESVEIISNPSAKYSSEGSAGIINLVMKKDREAGYFGSVNMGLSYPLHSKLGEIVGANVNFNTGKWDGYFNVSMRNMFNTSENFSDRDYLDENGTISRSLHQEGKSENNMLGLMSRLGLNYQLNDKNLLGVSGYYMNGKRDNESQTSYLEQNSTDILYDYLRKNNTNGRQNNGNAMFNHIYKYDKKTELNTTLAYSFSKMNGEANYLNLGNNVPSNLKDQLQSSNSKNQTVELKSDFSKTITQLSKIETGINARIQNRDSYSETENFDGTSFQIIPSLTDDYLYKEQVYAVYGTYGTKLKELSIHAGLRGEYTIVDNEGYGIKNPTKKYFELFPTAFLSYSLPKKNEVQLNYTRRINRPRGRQLNAFRDVSNPSNISYGNADLDPEFTNSLELNHLKSWDKLSVSSSLYYKYTTDVIQRVQFLDYAGIMNTTYMNVSKSQSAGLELVGKSPVTKFLNLTGTLNVFYYELFPSDFSTPLAPETVHIDGSSSFSWNFRLLANMMFSKTFSGQFTGNYISPRTVSQGSNEQQYSFDLGLKKTCMNKKLSLSFTVRDIFNTRKDISDTETTDFTQHSESWRYAPNFRLTAVYNFGNNNNKKSNGKKGKNGSENLLEEDNGMMEEY
jgi:outer membrane receptor protein involved in Fe transport